MFQGPSTHRDLDPSLLEDTLNALFPQARSETGLCIIDRDSESVTDEELSGAVKRMEARQTAFDPDGVPGKVLVMTANVLAWQHKRTVQRLLGEGEIPKSGK